MSEPGLTRLCELAEPFVALSTAHLADSVRRAGNRIVEHTPSGGVTTLT